MVIKICGRHGYREQGSNLSELSCPGCQEEQESQNERRLSKEYEGLSGDEVVDKVREKNTLDKDNGGEEGLE